MKKIVLKIGRFFWSRGFLKFVLWTITLVILFYIEEDWRGARIWAATKAKWEAKGESFDFSKLIPPPVPDSQNLAAIPLFKMEPDPKNNGNLEPLALQRACYEESPGLPSSGHWQRGQLPDMKKIKEGVAAVYAEAFKTSPPSDNPLEQFTALYPFIADLRSASVARKYCNFPQSYRYGPPDNLFISLMSAQMSVVKILTLHAILALNAHQPGVALDDIKINLKLISGLRREPLSVAGLCSIGMNSYSEAAVYAGLSLHSWDDIHLADLQNELAPIDFLSDYQRGMRGGCIGISIPAYDRMKKDRTELKKELKEVEIHESNPKRRIPDFWPDGWLDWMKAQIIDFHLKALRFVDLKTRTVSPEIFDQLTAETARRQNRWDADAPWSMVFSSEVINVMCSEMQTYAQAQVWVDEARIACALERYHLVHGAYPETLDALVPAYASELPHDIFNGQPYRYRLQPDGTYLLYSVGWNRKDDGGKISSKVGHLWSDQKQGDWVWPVPKGAR